MVVPFGEAEYYRVRPTSPSRSRAARAARSISTASSACTRAWPVQAALGPGPPRHRPRLGLARRHAVALRRAGLHGVGTPGVKSTRDGWLNRYLQALRQASARQGREERNPLRAVAMTRSDAARAPGHGAGAGHGQRRRVRRARRHERAATRSRAPTQAAADRVLKGTAAEAFDAMRTLRKQSAGRYRTGPRRHRIRARPSARRCRRSRRWPRRTSASRSRLPRAPSGTITSTKAARPARSPIAWTTSPPASPRWRRISATAWPIPSS